MITFKKTFDFYATDVELDDEETPTEAGSGFSGVASKKFSSDSNQMLTFTNFI